MLPHSQPRDRIEPKWDRIKTHVAPIRGLPMPANEKDIKKLRDLLKWAKTKKRGDAVWISLCDALESALNLLDSPDAKINIALFLLSAMLQSVKKTEIGYVVADRELNTWAIEQAEKLTTQEDSQK